MKDSSDPDAEALVLTPSRPRMPSIRVCVNLANSKGSVVSFSPLLGSWNSRLMLKEFMLIQLRECITKCPQSETVSQLQLFLGMVQYHSRFTPHVSTLLHLLTRFLQEGVLWNWTAQCEQAFTAVKQQFTGATVVTTYNPDLQLRLATDASAMVWEL